MEQLKNTILDMLTTWKEYCYSRTEQADDLGNTRVADCDGCKFITICKNNDGPFAWSDSMIDMNATNVSEVMETKSYKQPQGYWQRNIKTTSAHYRCTNCGHVTYDPCQYECPNCKARMGGIWTDVN